MLVVAGHVEPDELDGAVALVRMLDRVERGEGVAPDERVAPRMGHEHVGPSAMLRRAGTAENRSPSTSPTLRLRMPCPASDPESAAGGAVRAATCVGLAPSRSMRQTPVEKGGRCQIVARIGSRRPRLPAILNRWLAAPG